MRNLVILLILSLIWPMTISAQVEQLLIGQGGLDWRESSDDMLGLDDAIAVGSLQPFEIDPSVNIAVGPQTDAGQFTNIFGHVWEISGGAPPFVDAKVPWVYGARGRAQTVDGDIDRPTDVAEVSDYTFDLGFPIPLNRVVFFPPEKGRTTTRGSSGLLIKDLYPRQYVVSGSLNEQEFLFTSRSGDFANVLGSNFSQGERIADVGFATEFLQFIRVRFPALGFIAEVQFYGEGFLPQTRYVSQLFDMGEPVNFGRLLYDFAVYRSPGSGGEPVLAAEAPVRLALEVRSGRDDTPLIYHIVTEIGREKEVTEVEYNRAPTGTYRGSGKIAAVNGVQQTIPGQQGSIRDDVTNWSFWSAPHQTSGEDIQAPDGRQFVQVRAIITSEEVFAFGRLNSLAIEFSPLLANPVVGEVALMDEPEPADGVVEVPLGELVTLTYDVRADFSSDEQVGFNAIRLRTPEAVAFERFEMGDPLQAIEPDSFFVGDQQLVVYFPSHPITQASNPPLRFTFGTRVFNFNTLFEGEVFQIGGENLPQSIDGGDATPWVSTNDLQVFAPLQYLQVLAGVELGGGVLTPNGDGINDGLAVSFTLQGISLGKVEVGIYDLGGRLVHRLVSETRSEGHYREIWDGSSGGGVVAPGLYLVRVSVGTDLGDFEQLRTIAVAY